MGRSNHTVGITKAACAVILFITCAGCFYAPQGSIAGRWDFKAVDMPDVAGFIDSIKSGDEDVKESMESFFSGDKLVLKKDHTCDLAIFKNYLHGTWKFDENTGMLSIMDETGHVPPVLMKVNKADGLHMAITADNENIDKLVPGCQYGTAGYTYFKIKRRFTFYLLADGESYWQSANDPYSKANNLWRIKPHSPETTEQITDRVRRHLQFCRLVIQDAIDNKGYVSFNWFATPLVLSSSGGRLRDYDRLKDEWEANFYNPEQALQGYVMLRKSLYNSLFTPDETRTRFENYLTILDGLIEQLGK